MSGSIRDHTNADVTPDGSLVAALARAQAKFTTVAKSHTAEVPTKTGGKYSYTYANRKLTRSTIAPEIKAGVMMANII